MFSNQDLSQITKISTHRGLVFGVMIIMALMAFEVFNFGTTEFALRDLIGEVNFLGIQWATILAIAFCGIDFAGIARIFTPERGSDEHLETWLLLGAWILAASMNALLTWWGVSLAILYHSNLGNEIVEKGVLLQVIPIFVAVMVWLIRVLIVGTFSLSGERLFSQTNNRIRTFRKPGVQPVLTVFEEGDHLPHRSIVQEVPIGFKPAPKPGVPKREPTYRSLNLSGRH